jgi:ubiquinone/menaquinone biosynthesis C-methylase UbiE
MSLSDEIQEYWNERIHDLEITQHAVGSREFFNELGMYRFEKLDYLSDLVNFTDNQDKQVLEVGCGLGIDLMHFAKGGAVVTGIDLSETAIHLAQQYFRQEDQNCSWLIMNGEIMGLKDNTFDVVYAHGVIQYSANPQKMIQEIYRVLKPNGLAIVMAYNRYSWLRFLSRLTGVALEHEDAPAFHLFSISQFRKMLSCFGSVEIIPERFPVATRLHHGLKARLYNDFFVGTFNALPHSWVQPFGWHLMAFAQK